MSEEENMPDKAWLRSYDDGTRLTATRVEAWANQIPYIRKDIADKSLEEILKPIRDVQKRLDAIEDEVGWWDYFDNGDEPIIFTKARKAIKETLTLAKKEGVE